MENSLEKKENKLRNELINKILVVSMYVGALTVAGAQYRALSIGFTHRDLLQLSVLVFTIIIVLFRHKLQAKQKAWFLIAAYSFGGFSGFFTLGMLGGSVFVLPAAVVVISVFYSMRVTALYIGLYLLLGIVIAFRFCSGIARLEISADYFMTSWAHWNAYIICIAFIFSVTLVTVHYYRKSVESLMGIIKNQRDELVRTNEDLVNTSKKIKILSGLLPICSNCKKIRDDHDNWHRLETYIKKNSEADFTHGLCPACIKTLYPLDDDDSGSKN
jgi:hypothetical protein